MGDEFDNAGFDNPFSNFHASAAALREMFETYVGVGFTEEQALQICLTQLAIVGTNPHRGEE